jgi:8-oxo-dGTP pyrophosphatase MutT (NUDIX family)
MSDICNHTSVGVILKQGEKILLIKRRKFPISFACPAGHVDEGEDFEQAAIREIDEEVGLTITNLQLVLSETLQNPCRRKDGTYHDWKVYSADYHGEVVLATDEATEYCWVSQQELKKLLHGNGEDVLDPAWVEIFSKLHILA